MICRWVEDPNSEAFKHHIERVYDFLWVAEDGMKMKVLISSAFHYDFSWEHVLAFSWGGGGNNNKTRWFKSSLRHLVLLN